MRIFRCLSVVAYGVAIPCVGEVVAVRDNSYAGYANLSTSERMASAQRSNTADGANARAVAMAV